MNKKNKINYFKMSKFSTFFFSFLIFFSIISNSISVEKTTNSNDTNLKNESNTNEGEENDTYNDPFKDFDFGNVIWLDDTNATSEIQKDGLLYILFYAPWCKQCHTYIPDYVKVSKYAEENKIDIKFAKIDSGRSQNITDEFEVEGYPSVFLVNKTEKYFYEGENTKEGFIKFFNRKLNGDIIKVESVKEFNDYLNSNSSSPVVLLSTLMNPEIILYQSFLNYSKINMNIDFYICQTKECLKEYNQDIILFKKFDEKINKYTKDFGALSQAESNSVKNFVGIFAFETGAVLKANEINMMFEHQRKMLFYFRNSSLESQTKYDKVIKELGKEFRKEKIYTVVADIQGSVINENVASTFIIVSKDLPTLLFYDLNEDLSQSEIPNIYSIRNATTEQLSKEYIKDYIKNIKKGKIKVDLFSEPPLDNYDFNGVRYVIGRNYDKDVIEEKKNVLIMIIDRHAPCSECNTILSLMRNLTKKYSKEEKNVKFAYFDAGRNQPRDIDLQREMIPLLLLYTNSLEKKKIIKMAHKNFTAITEEDIEDFLSENLKWKEKAKNNTKKEKAFKSQEFIKDSKKKEENKKEEKKDVHTDL